MQRIFYLIPLLVLIPWLALATPPPGFGPKAALNSNATAAGTNIDQDVATDGLVWVAVWSGASGGDRDVLFARSVDTGLTWSAAATLDPAMGSDTEDDLLPRVATDLAGNWIIVWYSRESLGATIGSDYDILYSVSTDDGITWSSTAALNSRATTDSASDADMAPVVASNGAGTWVVVWRSSNPLGAMAGTDIDIHYAVSSDVGANWSAQAILDPNAGSDSGFDTAPEIASNGSSDWVAVWYSNDDAGGTIGTDYDILVSTSSDDGATFSASTALNSTAATDSGADLNPQIAADPFGNWLVVWRSTEDIGGAVGTDPDLFVARSTDAGASWTAPTAVNTNATTDTKDDLEPAIATDGMGTWAVLWYTDFDFGGMVGIDLDVFVSVSTDHGSTWCDPSQPGGDNPDLDYRTDIASDGAGNWLATWTSRDDLGGTIGNDDDIVVSRWPLFPPPHLPALRPFAIACLVGALWVGGALAARRRPRR